MRADRNAAIGLRVRELRAEGLLFREIGDLLSCTAGRARYELRCCTDRASGRLCECGCGQTTKLATQTRSEREQIEGEPLRFVPGHNAHVPEAERFWEKVDKEGPVPKVRPELGPCWVWMARRQSGGYGSLVVRSRTVYAHQWSYEQALGPIPEGLELDHLCRNRACVRPAHLEPVTHAVNVQRGAQAKLTATQVAEIRASTLRIVDLAEIYGVHNSQISRIRTKRAWSGPAA